MKTIGTSRLTRIGLGLLLITISTLVHAQLSQPHRYERVQKNMDDNFNVISLKEEGLALIRERNKFKNNNRLWELIILDTALTEKKTLELEIKDRHNMIGYEVTPGHLYLLFRTGETNRNELELIPVSLSEGEGERHRIDPDLDFKLTHFSMIEDKFIFGGYVNNDPAVLLYDLKTKRVKVVPGFFQKDTELVDLRVNVNQTFNVVLVNRNTKGDRMVIFRSFDGNGDLLMEDNIPLEEHRTIQTGITSTLEREDLVILGTWGERNSKQSSGFFSLSVDPFQDQKIHFIHFGELTNYLAYTSPKRAARIKESTKQDLAANKTPNFVNYVMPYRIKETPEGFLLLAESYQPSTNTSPYYTNPYYYNPYYSPYGMMPYGGGYYYPGAGRMYRPYNYSSNVKNTEEIKTQEGVLLLFNAQGKVVWDYSIVPKEELKRQSTEQVTDFDYSAGRVNLVFKHEMEITVKTIDVKTDSVRETTSKIKALDPTDEIRSEREYEGEIRHWFGHTYYVYGYQTVRNVTQADRVRDVFYVNKIQLE